VSAPRPTGFDARLDDLPYEAAFEWCQTLDLKQFEEIVTLKKDTGFSPLRPRLKNANLKAQRLTVFCLCEQPYDYTVPKFERILRTLFRKISQSEGVAGTQIPRYGQHWANIGFNDESPRNNLLGMSHVDYQGMELQGHGIFGILQLLHLLEAYEQLAADLYSCSIVNDFPMVMVCLNLSIVAISTLQTGNIYELIKNANSVTVVVNRVFAALVFSFYKAVQQGDKEWNVILREHKAKGNMSSSQIDTMISMAASQQHTLPPPEE
jgi:hypothetical protein